MGSVLGNFGSKSVNFGYVYVGRWTLDVGMFRKNSKKQAVSARRAACDARVLPAIRGLSHSIGAQKKLYRA